MCCANFFFELALSHALSKTCLPRDPDTASACSHVSPSHFGASDVARIMQPFFVPPPLLWGR